MTTNLTVTRTGVLALLDLDAPAKTVSLPEPDYFDADMAFWIGADAVIACGVDMLDHAASLAERGTWFARNGEFPCERGFMVKPHADLLIVTGVGLSKHKAQYDAWRAVMDTLLTEKAA